MSSVTLSFLGSIEPTLSSGKLPDSKNTLILKIDELVLNAIQLKLDSL
jgi:hypothetical protein